MRAVSYEWKRRAVIGSLGLYLLISFSLRVFTHQEIYPFFSWYLFADVPNYIVTYSVRFDSIGQERFAPPLEFQDAGPTFAPLRQSPTEYSFVIQAFGKAIAAGDEAQVERSRTQFEKIFRGKSAQYEIVRIGYDPYRYWQTHQFDFEQVLARYSVGI